ncbi:sulfurtransferase [Pseudodesulfovibrio nedwellii]|uniref:Sulfurtransferase n=1 Tax=Pseudodesulfovibrio nedwellii TaxID=2973072 RepID=A0ABM8AYZ6_9BACT|nr:MULTISPECIES: rhodanese-like domain-containing protein [Pseudodesulfovibrio]BDQ36727.1 sulfurtransferase [Pseudodesulfovibrio nedwellii]
MAQINMMTVDAARVFMGSRKPDSYTLLDVRQEWEYADEHIPGARLVPLVELIDHIDEIDKEKPVLAYCRSGGRSMAASALLEGQGFSDVNNLVGGMAGWNGEIAFGPMELGLIEFTGTETPAEVVLKAYAMESNLQRFYVERADMAETLERIELFMELAGFEDRHKDTLFTLYCKIVGREMDRDMFEKTAFTSIGLAAEGGVEISEFLAHHPAAFDDEEGILQLATMIEAQALDYYLRCARRAAESQTEAVLQTLAREEKAHLKLLGRYMDKREA